MADHRDFIDPMTGELDTAGLIAAYDERCEEVAAFEFENRKNIRSNRALRKELAQKHADDPRSHQIREVMEYWVAKCHKSNRTKIPMDGIRAQKVRARLNQDFTIDDLKQAIDGCAAKPFVGPRGRAGTQDPGCRREDDLELILRDEKNVERFQSYAKEAARETAKPALQAVPDTDEDQAMWAREAPSRGAVRYAYGDDCLLEPQPETPQQRDAREVKEAAKADERRRHEVVFGDPRPPIDRAMQACHTATGHFPTPAAGNNDSWMTLCPSHHDQSPSLRISRSPDGTVLFFCLAGCDNDQIIRDLGLEWRDLWDKSERDEEALHYTGRPRGPTPERKTELADALRQIQSTLVQWDREEAA